MSESMVFDDLTLRQVTVKIAGVEYSLKEASGKSAGIYRNFCMSCLNTGPNGSTSGIKNLADAEPLLVSMCLFDAQDKPVPQQVIGKWPSRIQKALFKKAKEISELTETPEEKQLLEKALNLDNAPLSLKDFRAWVENLPEEYAPLKAWVKPSSEELAKNELSDTTDG